MQHIESCMRNIRNDVWLAYSRDGNKLIDSNLEQYTSFRIESVASAAESKAMGNALPEPEFGRSRSAHSQPHDNTRSRCRLGWASWHGCLKSDLTSHLQV